MQEREAQLSVQYTAQFEEREGSWLVERARAGDMVGDGCERETGARDQPVWRRGKLREAENE